MKTNDILKEGSKPVNLVYCENNFGTISLKEDAIARFFFSRICAAGAEEESEFCSSKGTNHRFCSMIDLRTVDRDA